MKIDIITLFLHGNCGGVLHNFALQTVLKRIGRTVEAFRMQLHLGVEARRVLDLMLLLLAGKPPIQRKGA